MKARPAVLTFLAVLAAVLLVPAVTSGAYAPAQQLQTPAERVDYSQGGTLYEPLMDFVYELEASSDLMNVTKLTETLMGRDVVLATLSDPPVYRPSDLAGSDRPVVLIVNNVHGGEVAGKDAAMEIMRDLLHGELRPLLDEVVVLVVPTINPDGAEVRRRTNEEGFDLNRDYLKLESQEIHALVTQVIQEWQPDIWVDTHHGGSAPYTLTYQTNMNPAGDAELVAFGNDRILSRVRQALRAEDYDGFWYTGPGTVDGVAGWVPTSVEPRKQHVFATLANSVGFLFETPSGTHRVIDNGTEVVPIPDEQRYRHQVRGQYIGQRELIRFAAEEKDDLMAVVEAARERAVRLGNDDADNDQVVLEYRQVAKYEDSFWRRSGGGRGGRGGGGEVTYELVTAPIFTRFEPTRTTTRPYGYLIPPGMTRLVPILLEHDIAVKRLTEPMSLEVEAYDATAVETTEYFQGHYLRAVTADVSTETVDFPAGTFFVPSGQPLSNLISYLLEPETNDNLVTWGYLDNVLRQTPSAAEQEAQRQAMEERLAQMTPEQRAQAGGRGGRGFGGGPATQRVPIYRLMHRTDLGGELVRPFNEYDPSRYIR
ncbi:MAG: DUF2817 domain-containing protein [Acidobacteriota bacterium]